jgi:hypothetical protein
MGHHSGISVDGGAGLGGLVGAEVDAYWCSRRAAWSVRFRGRVVAHVGFLTLIRCRMVVQPSGRARALEQGQRSVHAWVRGGLSGETCDNTLGLARIGYSYSMAPTFTIRPGFAPVAAARRVVLRPDGSAWALL